MKALVRKAISVVWPFMILGGYLIYHAVIQYSALPSRFSSLAEADRCAWHLKYPWIGLGFGKATTDVPGEKIRMYSVEYLFREKDRVFVVAGKDANFRVIDEFVSAPQITSVELTNGTLRYLDYYGRPIFERTARKTPSLH